MEAAPSHLVSESMMILLEDQKNQLLIQTQIIESHSIPITCRHLQIWVLHLSHHTRLMLEVTLVEETQTTEIAR